jgi:hypothetical protein
VELDWTVVRGLGVPDRLLELGVSDVGSVVDVFTVHVLLV